MARTRHRQLLRIAATDATFERRTLRGEVLWVGRCIFCNRTLTLGEDGTPRSDVSVEHIVPRTHGGTDALDNLALACRGCNNEKGMRHDVRHRGDARLEAVIATLQERRRSRWREAASVGLADIDPWTGETR
jgi:5-methylcytosine-specific restriction endonuclease McrA